MSKFGDQAEAVNPPAGPSPGAADAQGRVMPNGVLVGVGESFKGVEFAEVDKNAVALRYKDEVLW